MSMTVSSETMHENHNRDAAYDSVDIPLSLSSVDMTAANTEKNWSQPILEKDPYLSDLQFFHAHVVPRKKDVHLQAQYLQVHTHTHTHAWHRQFQKPIHTFSGFPPVHILNADAHTTYAVTETERDTCGQLNLFIYPTCSFSRTCSYTQWNTHSERTEVAGWTCSFYSIHTHSEKHVQTCRPKKKDYRIIPW